MIINPKNINNTNINFVAKIFHIKNTRIRNISVHKKISIPNA